MLANLHKMHGFYKTDGANRISKLNCWEVAGEFQEVAGKFQGSSRELQGSSREFRGRV